MDFCKSWADVGWDSHWSLYFSEASLNWHAISHNPFYRLSFKQNTRRLGKNNPILRCVLASTVKNTAKYYLMNFPENQSTYSDSFKNINNNHMLFLIHQLDRTLHHYSQCRDPGVDAAKGQVAPPTEGAVRAGPNQTLLESRCELAGPLLNLICSGAG